MLNYIPILTTLFSAFFFVKIFNHYKNNPKKTYVLWWMIGVLTFGLGTLTESLNALVGWHVLNTRIWYIVGALLGGFPLAQGTIYLLMRKKTADILTVIFVTVIVVASVCVMLTPIEIPPSFDYQLTGKVFQWEWVRLFSPFINIYSFIFLVGGAFYSAFKYFRSKKAKGKKPWEYLHRHWRIASGHWRHLYPDGICARTFCNRIYRIAFDLHGLYHNQK